MKWEWGPHKFDWNGLLHISVFLGAVGGSRFSSRMSICAIARMDKGKRLKCTMRRLRTLFSSALRHFLTFFDKVFSQKAPKVAFLAGAISAWCFGHPDRATGQERGSLPSCLFFQPCPPPNRGGSAGCTAGPSGGGGGGGAELRPGARPLRVVARAAAVPRAAHGGHRRPAAGHPAGRGGGGVWAGLPVAWLGRMAASPSPLICQKIP